MTDTSTSPDVTPLSDLDASPTCEVFLVTETGQLLTPCKNPATWWGISLCCGLRGLACNSCKRHIGGRFQECNSCRGQGMRWVKL